MFRVLSLERKRGRLERGWYPRSEFILFDLIFFVKSAWGPILDTPPVRVAKQLVRRDETPDGNGSGEIISEGILP